MGSFFIPYIQLNNQGAQTGHWIPTRCSLDPKELIVWDGDGDEWISGTDLGAPWKPMTEPWDWYFFLPTWMLNQKIGGFENPPKWMVKIMV